MKTKKIIFPVLAATTALILTGMMILNNKENQNKQYYYFEDPMECSGCHWDRFERWSVSQHSKGFSGDFFQAQYYELVLPSLGLDEKLEDAHEGCIGCHSPSELHRRLCPLSGRGDVRRVDGGPRRGIYGREARSGRGD
ncbi:MAG: multiheme c-type cytochrome [Bacteroidales bacterium]